MTTSNAELELVEQYKNALVTLVRKADVLPPFLFLDSIQKVSEFCVESGSYGDVYEGLWKGQRIAIKVIRVQGVALERKLEILRVRSFTVAQFILKEICINRIFGEKQHTGSNSHILTS